ncbi:MAG TPA: M15 family metallopeptidase [Vicinamibacterales bacterium]|nr:M15 family metallopeptidase [Vicinamibacterales bacterium]
MRRSARLTPSGNRRDAELFYADLTGRRFHRRPHPIPAPDERPAPAPVIYPRAGQIPRTPAAARDDDDVEEAVPLRGRGRFRHEPLGGDPGDNVETRWNVDAATASGSTIDIVVHLHGYGTPGSGFIAGKAAVAGVDLVDDAGTVRVRASQATLALVPRGRHAGGETWVFDTLSDRAAFDRLVDAGLQWLCATVLGLPSGSSLKRGRLTLAAHSGGGAGVSALLGNGLNPDEVICFDSMYGGEDSIRRWAEARIASADAPRSGLRVFYGGCSAPVASYPAGRWVARRSGGYGYEGPGSWSYRGDHKWHLITTEVSARRLHHALERALSRASGGAALVTRFRVQRTSVTHNDIPSTYSPALLENIAADVPRTSSPPPATSRPVCVANDDWLTNPARKPFGDDPPPPRPSAAATATEEAPPFAAEDAYVPPGARAYTRSADAALFRVAPSPVAVTGATQWPQATTDGDGASERALRALGVTAAGIHTFGAAGMTALRPIASAFGDAALTELLQRLRYSARRLTDPRHSYNRDADLAHAFGRAMPHPVILSMRTLLAIPGHFRELARLAGTDAEAFALEIIGWLLMQSLRDEVRTAGGFDFWLPTSPAFVTKFASGLPGLSPQITQLIAARTLTDSGVDAAAYRTKFSAWQTGAPGRLWRLETGRDTSSTGRAAGAPFYSDPFTIPATINIAAERSQVQAAWRSRLADFDAGRTTRPLTECEPSYLSRVHVLGPIALGGLQLREKFPSPSTAATVTELRGLAAVQPAFTAAFTAIANLGWNDLVFETQGMGCFRGKKIPGNPAAARNMSEHSLGIAVDLNAFENPQHTTGSMDPRVVALFEAFRFRWGKGFPTPDPMHFEYAG